MVDSTKTNTSQLFVKQLIINENTKKKKFFPHTRILIIDRRDSWKEIFDKLLTHNCININKVQSFDNHNHLEDYDYLFLQWEPHRNFLTRIFKNIVQFYWPDITFDVFRSIHDQITMNNDTMIIEITKMRQIYSKGLNQNLSTQQQLLQLNNCLLWYKYLNVDTDTIALVNV